MIDNIYEFFISLLSKTNSFASENEANEFLSSYAKNKYKKQKDIAAFVNKFVVKRATTRSFKIVPKKKESDKYLELPTSNVSEYLYKYKALKREIPISKFKLKAPILLSKKDKEIINNLKLDISENKKHPVIIIFNNKIIKGKFELYALKQLGYKKVYVYLLKERESLTESKDLINVDLEQQISLHLTTFISVVQHLIDSNTFEHDYEALSQKALSNIGYIIKKTYPNVNVFLDTTNTEGESFELYVTDWMDVISIYLPFITHYRRGYKVDESDVEIVKMGQPKMSFLDNLENNFGEYEQIMESRFFHQYNYSGDKKELYDYIKSLSPYFVQKAQKIYDEWEQDENGVDEILGTGGICQDIAEEMCEIFDRNKQGNKFSCYSSGEYYDFHVVMYAYISPEYLTQDEDGNNENEVLFEVDIPYDNYETGGGFTWKKKPNIKFDDSMVIISDLYDGA